MTQIERRTDKRLQVHEKVLAMAGFNATNLLCNIENISRSGVSFNYPAISEGPHQIKTLSILIGDAIFSLHNLSIRKVWSHEIACGLERRFRVGCRFLQLSRKQESELDEFIRKYTNH